MEDGDFPQQVKKNSHLMRSEMKDLRIFFVMCRRSPVYLWGIVL